MNPADQTLTGPWMGRYNYVSVPLPPVAFNVVLTDKNGEVSGDSIEPNTFPDVDLDSLMAGIVGVREGTWLEFTKTYSDIDAPRIDYSGRINGTFTRVDGTWNFFNAPWQKGTFVLIRDAVGVEADIRRKRVTTEKLSLRRDG